MSTAHEVERCILCCGEVDIFGVADCCQHVYCILCLVYYWHHTKPNVICAVCKKRITRFAASDSPAPRHGSAQKAGLLRQAVDMELLMVDYSSDFLISECDGGTFALIFNSAQMKEMFPSPHFRWLFDEDARKQIPETRLYKAFFRKHGTERALHPALIMNRTTKYRFVSLVGRATNHTEYTEIVATRDGLLWVAIYDRSYKPETT